MTAFKTIQTVSAGAIAALFAAPAFAGIQAPNTDKAQEDAVVTQTQTVRTLDADGRVGEITIFTVERSERDQAVLGALALQTTDAYVVQDEDGDFYINHLVPVEDLQDPTLNVEAEDTYQIEYRGMVFTNKIVEPR